MRSSLVNVASLAAMAFFQVNGRADDEVLKDKIVRSILNHNEPVLVKVGTNGVTSLEFPYKIEAIEGYGFSQSPGSGDAFQISYTKGTNYFSVRALKPGVTGNLSVILDQKVYALFFEESGSPTFVDIFGPGGEGGFAASSGPVIAETNKRPTQVQLGGLLGKIKSYAALKTNSPQMLDGLQVAEPGKKIALDNLVESTICRILKDDSLNSAAFEVEVDNRSSNDFLYDPQELQVRVKDAVYGASLEDATGIVKAQTNATIFFVVNDADSARPNDLAPGNDFDLVIKGNMEWKSEELTFNEPPGNFLPTARTIDQAAPVPEPRITLGEGGDHLPPSGLLPVKHASSRKVTKKSDPKAENSPKTNVAKTQKPFSKKLFGWL